MTGTPNLGEADPQHNLVNGNTTRNPPVPKPSFAHLTRPKVGLAVGKTLLTCPAPSEMTTSSMESPERGLGVLRSQ